MHYPRIQQRSTVVVRSSLLAAVSFLTSLLLQAQPALAQQDISGLEAAIDEYVRGQMSEDQIPGMSIAVARGDRVLIAKGYGNANVELAVPATGKTVYRLGSVTKQFTSTAIMQLVERGEIALEDEITKYLPDFPLQGHTVTVYHLLNHSSGIKSYTGMGEKWREVIREDLTHEELLALVKDEPFDFEPGEDYAYNNSGYYLLGMILERVTGKRYDEYIRDTFFEPLGMTASTYGWHEPIIPNRATGYTLEEGELRNSSYLSMHQPFSAGALLSTVEDLVKWNRALHGGRLVSAASYEQMTTPLILPNGRNTGYGFGLAIGELEGHRKISHGGGINGFVSSLAWYPDDDLTVVVLINTDSANSGRIEVMITRLVLGLPVPTARDLPLTVEEMQPYLGTYDLGGQMQIRVFEEDGNLITQATGQGSFRLLYQGGHEFAASFNEAVRVTFVIEAGRAVKMVIDQGGQTMEAARIPPY